MRELTGDEALGALGLTLVPRRQSTHHRYECPRSVGLRGVECGCPGGPQTFIYPAHFRGGAVSNDNGTHTQWRPGAKEKPLPAGRPLALAEKSCTVAATTSEEDANG